MTLPVPRGRRGHRELPGPLAAVLRRAHEAEVRAEGPELRNARRITRQLIGAVLEVGYTNRVVGQILGIHPDTVRTRAEHGGALTPEAFRSITDLEPRSVRWQVVILRDGHHESYCTALDLVRALDTVVPYGWSPGTPVIEPHGVSPTLVVE